MGTRLIDWEDRLGDTVNRLIGQPFEWGKTDCVAVGLRCVEAMTGAKHEADWHSKTSAIDAAAKCGVTEWLTKHGFVQLENPVFASTGDVILIPLADYPSINVVVGGRAVTATIERGVCTDGLHQVLAQEDVTVWRLE